MRLLISTSINFLSLTAKTILKNLSKLLLIAIVGFPLYVAAQDTGKDQIPLDHFYATPRHGSSFFRRALRNFHFGIYTGVGRSYLSTSMSGFGVYQSPGAPPQLFTNSTTTRYTDWVNNAGVDNSPPGSYVVANAGNNIRFKGHALNIPLAATLHYEYKQLRLGGGYSYELMSLGLFHPTTMADKISDMKVSSATGFVRRYWGMVGYSFYRWNDYLFTGDLQVGNYKMKNNYNTAQVTPSTYFNLGVTIERNLSEYLKVFVRPAYEFKSYSLAVSNSGSSLNYSNNMLMVSVGFTYSIPQLPKCVIKQCRAQVDHHHGNRDYRSRVHPFYKKQNPGYGENYPGLKKY
ncbi:MAG: hypothetical protein JST43_07005 [Bacteroidetes bacterium]|nr:hypothetical protein [Bacteroidota bacterium]MBS1539702.1 hypothetical protein [Bacteroidota bacterium]